MSVNPSGMCCTTTIVEGKSAGSCDKTNSRACGPPVETPMATTLLGSAEGAADFCGFGGSPVSMRGFNLQSAAALILTISSRATSVMCAEGSLGLGTKSNAPKPSAFMVTVAPSVLCELNTITGTGWRQFLDLLQTERTIHRGSDYFDGFVARQHLRDQLAHQGRIVDYQHADSLHARPPTDGVRASRMRSVWVRSRPELACPISCGRACATCSTIAVKLRISTTRPSPRMEAPETRSVENV